MLRIAYVSPQQIMSVVHEMLAQDETDLIIDFFTITHNPHDVVAVHDFLSYHKAHSGLNIIVRLQGLSNVFNLAIASVADPDKRLVSSLGCTYFHGLKGWSMGTAKDLIIAANANIALQGKIETFITNGFNVSVEELRQLMEDDGFKENKDMLSWGLVEWTQLDMEMPVVSLADAEPVEKQYGIVEGE